MVFNVLAHNRDDHVKNFAFILDDDSGEEHFLQLGERFLMSKQEVEGIVDEVQGSVSRWAEFAVLAGMTP